MYKPHDQLIFPSDPLTPEPTLVNQLHHTTHPSKHIAAEPFWGVRVAVAEALSDAPSNASAAILVGDRFFVGGSMV